MTLLDDLRAISVPQNVLDAEMLIVAEVLSRLPPGYNGRCSYSVKETDSVLLRALVQHIDEDRLGWEGPFDDDPDGLYISITQSLGDWWAEKSAKSTTIVTPQEKSVKRGRRSTAERDEEIANEYWEGFESGEFLGQVDYLKKRHPKRVAENLDNAKAWLSTLLKRVKENRDN